MAGTLPPDLTAGARIVVEHCDCGALARRCLRCVQSGRTGAYHDDVEMLLHRLAVVVGALVTLTALATAAAVQTTCPSRQSVWHANTCARPSIVTRHSWQIPIPHSAARGSPLTDVRVR